MRIAKVLLIGFCCLAVAPAWAQTANSAAKTGVLGFFDPQTGAFRPAQTIGEDVEPAAVATFGGTINVTLTITVKTAGITNVTCTAEVTVLDGTTSFTNYFETDTVAATGTGATRSCKLVIPYSWSLASQLTDFMSTSYHVSGGAGATGLPQRTAGRSPLDNRKVPANGTITNLTANVTI
jgi:hypothetical protein